MANKNGTIAHHQDTPQTLYYSGMITCAMINYLCATTSAKAKPSNKLQLFCILIMLKRKKRKKKIMQASGNVG